MRRILLFGVLATVLAAALPCSAEDVLIYDEHFVGANSDLEVGCNLTGDYTCTRVEDETTLASELDGGAYDIVMVDLLYGWFANANTESSLLAFIYAGGGAVVHLAGLEAHPSFAESLGAVVMATHNGVQDVNGSGVMFNNAADGGHSVPTPLTAGASISGVDQELDVSGSDPTAEAVFAYDTIFGAPAAVTSLSSTAVLLGFSPDETGRADMDSDGVIDVQEFLSNCIDFTLTCYDADCDGDGYTTCGEPADCDDEDDDVHPGALEVPADGTDSNCDGNDGDDADGDGYGSPESGGDDCDDSDDTIHPGADESPNGVDDDCDEDVDEGTELADDDGDGYSEEDGDCDDEDDDISPEVSESCFDGIDNNCDGLIDGETVETCPEVGDDDDDDETPPGGSSTVGGCKCGTSTRSAGSTVALVLLALLFATRRAR